MQYIAKLVKVYYVPNEEVHTVAYAKQCEKLAKSYAENSFANSVKSQLIKTDNEHDLREKIISYIKSVFDGKVVDFSFDVRIYAIDENGQFYIDGYGSNINYINPTEKEVNE